MTRDNGSFAERLERRRSELAAYQQQQAEAQRVFAEQQHAANAAAEEQRQRSRVEIQAEAERKAAVHATKVAAQLALMGQVREDGVEAVAMLRKMHVRPNINSYVNEGVLRGIRAWLLRINSSLNEHTETRYASERGYTIGHEYSVTYHTRKTHVFVLTGLGEVLEKYNVKDSYLPLPPSAGFQNFPPNYAPDAQVIEEPKQSGIIRMINKEGLVVPELDGLKVKTFQNYILDLVLRHQQ